MMSSRHKDNIEKANAEVAAANKIMADFVATLYKRLGEHTPNIDAAGRVLVAVPWSDAGRRLWGLRSVDAVILRKIMVARSKYDDWLLYYCHGSHCWRLRLDRYPTAAAALARLAQKPLQAEAWVKRLDAIKSAGLGRQKAFRARKTGKSKPKKTRHTQINTQHNTYALPRA